MRQTLEAALVGLILVITCQPVHGAPAAGQSNDDVALWKTFTNRAGWAIKYPPDWEVGSCNNCSDPTDPKVFVNFYDPAANELVAVEHLRDKPSDQSVEEWLQHFARGSDPNSAERMSLDGRKALKVKWRYRDSDYEIIYVVNGSQTFSISPSKVDDTPFYRLYLQMLSTFRFSEPRMEPNASAHGTSRTPAIKQKSLRG